MDPRSEGKWNPADHRFFLTPVEQLADWLESYAKVMELDVWSSSTVTSAEKDASGTWVVNLTRILLDGTESKHVLRPTHLVLATGLAAGAINVPKFSKQVLLPLSYCVTTRHFYLSTGFRRFSNAHLLMS